MSENTGIWDAIKSLQEQATLLADNQKTILRIINILKNNIKALDKEARK